MIRVALIRVHHVLMLMQIYWYRWGNEDVKVDTTTRYQVATRWTAKSEILHVTSELEEPKITAMGVILDISFYRR